MAIQRVHQRQVRSSNPEQYQSFQEQVLGMSTPFFQFIRPTQGQQNIILGDGAAYRLGTGQLGVYLNGQILEPGPDKDYIELTEVEIQFNYPLDAQDVVLLRMEGAGGGVTAADHAHYYSIPLQGQVNGINKSFQLPQIPRSGTAIALYVNGIRQHPKHFTVILNRVEFLDAPALDAELMADYIS